jgi:hypothetical protein
MLQEVICERLKGIGLLQVHAFGIQMKLADEAMQGVSVQPC